jgi:hypothetical protein
MASVAALELLAAWLGAGRLVTSAGDLGAVELLDHVDTLCALRSSRRWSGLVTMRMLVSIHVGRSAWLTRSLRVSVRARAALQTRFDREFERGWAAENRLLDRVNAAQGRAEEAEQELDERDREYEALQDRFRDMSDYAQGLEIELHALRSFSWGE